MSLLDDIKAQMAKCQEELTGGNNVILQLKEAAEKIANDIKTAQSRVHTFGGAVQAFDLVVKSLESAAGLTDAPTPSTPAAASNDATVANGS